MTDFRDKFNGGLSFNFDKPDFQKEYGTGTVSEARDKTNKGENAANIISASADGLDSVGGIISMFMGKPNPNTNEKNTYTEPPPSTKAPINPLVVGGISLGVILLIVLLISSTNGKAKQA